MSDAKDKAVDMAEEAISKSGMPATIATVFIVLSVFLVGVIGNTARSDVNKRIVDLYELNFSRINEQQDKLNAVLEWAKCVEFRHAKSHPENQRCS